MTHQGEDMDRQETRRTEGMAPPAEAGVHLEAADPQEEDGARQAAEDPLEAATRYSRIHSETQTVGEAQEAPQEEAHRTATAMTATATGTLHGCPAERINGIEC